LKFERKSSQTSNKQGMKYQAEISLGQHCYKVNRRYFEGQLFDRMMIAAVERPWYDSNTNT